MQQKERKGAWTLFIAILLFGAIVWGYGGYERDKERKAAEEIKLEKIEQREEPSEDSVDTVKRSQKKKNYNNRRQGKSGKKKEETTTVRDIRSDEINSTL